MNRAKIALCCLALIGAICPAAFHVAASHRAPASFNQELSPADTVIELEPVLASLTSPLYVTGARDGSNRLFIVEQPGRIKILEPGATDATVFLDITSRVLSGGERGLLGLAFHPQFKDNRRFFVNYTRRSDGATMVAEYRASSSNPNAADTNETTLLVIPQPFANHNGGMIEFGPDGFLYIATGDGGSANDPGNRAQNIEELLGKILRIDVDHTDGAQPYSSPSTNPFFGPAAGRDEIYAVGLRNPFRFSFDRKTGQLFAGDVGQNAREEVDIITAGGNYGWRVFEGTLCTNLGPAACNPGSFIAPIAEYGHSGERCSITGGYVYRGAKSSLPFGAYIFGDFCTGEIFLLDGNTSQLLLDTNLNISSFGEDEAGELYVVGLGGSVHRIVNPNAPPPATLVINSAAVRRRSTGEMLDIVTTKNNGKKFEMIVTGAGFVSGSVVIVNGREMKTELEATQAEAARLIARLRRNTLAEPGPLIVEVMNPDGSRSNQIALQVVEDR